ncbi:ABC transporter permease [Candidatus Woesearchaeota archaeon]|nr:ABC transporter permease [Candidatus Woesearchaeota archaeon]
MIGIFIGVAAVVALVSLGQGMKDAVNSQFSAVGTDKIIVQGASAGFGPPGQNTAGAVDVDDLELVRKVTGVRRAAGRLLRSMNFEYGGGSVVTFAASIPETPDDRDLVIEANNIKVSQGRLLKPGDKRKILIGNHLWTVDHFPKKIVLGSKMTIQDEQFEVVGLLQKIGAGRDEAVFMNEDDVRDLIDDKDVYSVIVAQADAGVKPAVVSNRILATIRKDRHQKEGFEDVTVTTSEDLIASINIILGVVQAVFVGIALISLLVGGIGIMNTMYTAVLQRAQEIGIIKAIGGRNEHVLWIFLLESGLLGLTGGAIGIITGIGLSKTVEFAAKGWLGNVLKASFPWYLIVGALLFSFVIGMVSGALPARQASMLPPVDALRGA